jgi:hypothetical protein
MKPKKCTRNAFVAAMNARHKGNTTMRHRSDRRRGNPKKSWKNDA